MLGIESNDDDYSCLERELGQLIDHNNCKNSNSSSNTTIPCLNPPPSAKPKLAWDGRKGQWIPVSFSYTFPKSAFDHLKSVPSASASPIANEMKCRKLARFSFPPSKRHAVMLDPGSPRLRVFPKLGVSNSRHPTSVQKTKKSRSQPKSPLRRHAVAWDETEEEDDDYIAKNRPEMMADPFTTGTDTGADGEATDNFDPLRLNAKPMAWLDDFDIEDFLSSAVDYQVDCQLLTNLNPDTAPLSSSSSNMPLADPIITASSVLSRIRRVSPNAMPSSPPPPLFPSIRISPSRL